MIYVSRRNDISMENEVKTWTVIYKHPFTGKTVKTVVFSRDKSEAMQQAMKNNVPTRGDSFFWEIESIEEKV